MATDKRMNHSARNLGFDRSRHVSDVIVEFTFVNGLLVVEPFLSECILVSVNHTANNKVLLTQWPARRKTAEGQYHKAGGRVECSIPR